MNPARRRAIFERFAQANPHPKGELDWKTPFQLLVAYQNADSKVPEKVRNALQDAPLKV